MTNTAATPTPRPAGLRAGDQVQTAAELQEIWDTDPRWDGVERTYSAEDVVRIRGSVREDATLAHRGAENLWNLLHTEDYIRALGAYTGGQAVQQVRAGLKAIYLSGWQVAADGNLAGQTYPDQSLYPANSVPAVVRRINNALLRQDQLEHAEGEITQDWLAPIVADAEAGFGGPLNAYELAQSLIQSGAAGIHWEDQLASEKKCGHLGGKVLVPTQQHIRTLNAARLAADVAGVPTVIIARTDALAADLLTSDVDERDREFTTGERTSEGFYRVRPGIESIISRGLAFAPYADLLWVETGEPDIELAREFAAAIHAQFPGKLLAYNCSPSFNWKRHLSDAEIATFQQELADLGYKFQFITLAGFHALNHSMFDLARGYAERAMSAYVELQEAEFAAEADGYTATKHQREAGTGYFDVISTALNPDSATLALAGSTETAQFH
ncbi:MULTISPECIES: isocitrate lyase [unclassified Microbacterium]|uniref:isocitrate lyase n=1 Tax=unclassified Microbacterium TaxID=2609290 RepID=UPI0024685092|nr:MULTISPECIES: isocitrate lyase [unclassified Microbacterium]MDH5132163.1 isocitrate lyase [Microbacterium sp. RD10]MDH5135890.1 isocitrate lyase [Microbacterium sp. RD11]MDH5143912.1 isocitrate lyase [Microbacterium sp. RD12]MDH5153132.1 isocitrate lyase [Microbacterium sp. RD06]MDH5164784.1 isocitrate lyase [Microbacterium sp. RD02]